MGRALPSWRPQAARGLRSTGNATRRPVSRAARLHCCGRPRRLVYLRVVVIFTASFFDVSTVEVPFSRRFRPAPTVTLAFGVTRTLPRQYAPGFTLGVYHPAPVTEAVMSAEVL